MPLGWTILRGPALANAIQQFARDCRQLLARHECTLYDDCRSFGCGGHASARMALMQLERLLQSQGFGSRKQCRQLIENGWVEVAGQRCEDPRAEFTPQGLEFTVDEERWTYRERAYVLLHKPAGYECSRTPQHHRSVLSLLPLPLQVRGVQPVGRLDQDTTGLLLLSDDGGFIHRVSSPRQHVGKTYLARVRHALDAQQVERLRQGVLLHGEEAPLQARDVLVLDEHHVQLTIDQGIYHQVKRMLAAAGNRCEGLHRQAIGGLQLGDLPSGQWRWLDEQELPLVLQDATAQIP